MSNRAISSLLLVEDNRGDARLLVEMFKEEGFDRIAVKHVLTMCDAEAHLSCQAADIIVIDLGLPDVQGLDAVRRAHAAAPRTPLVVLTGLDDEGLAVQALQEGAQDYLVKGQIETRGLMRALRYAIERNMMEEALSAEQERAQFTLNCLGDAVACTDTFGRLTFLNLRAEKLTGWTRQEAMGRPMDEVVQIRSDDGRGPTPHPMEMAVKYDQETHLPRNCVLVRKDGFETPIEDSVAPIHDRQGQNTGAVIVFRDVSVARAMARQITHSAEHDSLTGLPNRLLLIDRVGQAIAFAERHAKKVALLYLDLDGFKHINDSLGHPIGDKVLQAVAARLGTCVRASDTVSRQGGDEFILLLTELDHWEYAAATALRIKNLLEEPHSIDGRDLHITASIGVSIYPDDGPDAETLIKNADTAMYQAKENGRQGCQFFKPSMYLRAVQRQSIEESLRRALERREFALHYQPKVSLVTGEITGAEALIRWAHPTLGMMSPAEFIPVAEDSGLILPIGRWVLREACTQAKAWLDAGLSPGTMAVNISAVEFRSDSFLEGVFEVLDETGLDPSFLELELTESVLMKRAEVAQGILDALRAKGVQVAIDDFGTGYSSLSYLRKFQIDSLKIDQSFVRQITAVPAETSIVTAVISMGRSLKLRVVAEGVEKQEDLALLRRQHCDEAQGYYFSRPVPAAQFARLLEGGRFCLRTDVEPGAAHAVQDGGRVSENASLHPGPLALDASPRQCGALAGASEAA